MYTQRRNAPADTNRAIRQHEQILSPSYCWTLFLIFFIISISPASCDGAWTDAHPQSRAT